MVDEKGVSVTFIMSPTLLRQLDHYCESHDRIRSQIIRGLILDFLKAHHDQETQPIREALHG